jgi:hypothetical protein
MGSVMCTCKHSKGQQDSKNFGQFLDQPIVCHSSRTLVRNEIPDIPVGQLVTTDKPMRQFSAASLAAYPLVCPFFFNCPSFYLTVNTLFCHLEFMMENRTSETYGGNIPFQHAWYSQFNEQHRGDCIYLTLE